MTEVYRRGVTGFGFELDGEPKTWKRTTGYQGRRLTPKGQRQHQQALRTAAARALPPGWDPSARYAVEVIVLPSRRSTGDLDNYAKNVLDALEGVAWVNDRQIDRLTVERGLDRERPRTVVHIEPREAL